MSHAISEALPSARQRISVQLDRSVLIERLLLKRWEACTRQAQQTWLRSLLVQGFMVECALLRVADLRQYPNFPDRHAQLTPRNSLSNYGTWLAERSTRNTASIERPVRSPVPVTVITSGDKPFAHLRRVIG